MGKDASIAPKERINIVYKPATGDQQEQVELPFKLLVLGDFTNRKNAATVEDRAPINVDAASFNDVLKEQKLSVDMTVVDKLSGEDDATLSVSLKFDSINDFTPDSIVASVPELTKLLKLRDALKALKAPLGNVPNFRKKLNDLVKDESARQQLLSELQIDSE
jgi:type VI secretion system protein ImpB